MSNGIFFKYLLKQEVEEYVEHVFKASSDKIKFLEKENQDLKVQLDDCRKKSSLTSSSSSSHFGLNDNLCDSLKMKSGGGGIKNFFKM